MAESFLTKAGIAFEKVYADENAALVSEYGVKMAPTLIVQTADGTEKITNVSNIRKYIEQLA